MVRATLTFFRRIVLAATMLILVVCGAEVGVRLYETLGGAKPCPPADGNCVDPSKLTIPSWSCHFELKPQSTARVLCLDSNTEIDISTNSRGLRGSEPIVPKPRDLYRILVVGDETIFAPETSDADHFCSKLQSRLQQNSQRQIEVINAGIPGQCPLSEYIFFEQRLISLQPDLVLLHFDWSDVADDRSIRRHSKCDESGTPLSCPHATLTARKSVRQIDAWRQQFRLFDRLLGSISQEWQQQLVKQRATSRDSDSNPYSWLRNEHPEDNVAFRAAVKPILDFAKLCRMSNCRFVVMTSPKPWQVSAKCSRGKGVRLAAGVSRDACYLNLAPFEILRHFADRQQIPFIDGSAALVSGNEPEANFLNHAPRWSPLGHERISELVANSLIEKVSGLHTTPYPQRQQPPVTNVIPSIPDIQWTSGQTPTPLIRSKTR